MTFEKLRDLNEVLISFISSYTEVTLFLTLAIFSSRDPAVTSHQYKSNYDALYATSVSSFVFELCANQPSYVYMCSFRSGIMDLQHVDLGTYAYYCVNLHNSILLYT